MAIKSIDKSTSVATVKCVGLVLNYWTECGYQVMSDVYVNAKKALVWDVEHACPVEAVVAVEDASFDTHISQVTVDASEEVIEAFRQYLILYYFEKMVRNAEQDNAKIRKGDTVRIVKGRLGNIGDVGKVVHHIDANYGPKGLARKLLLAFSDETTTVTKNGYSRVEYVNKCWVWERNVEHTHPKGIDTSIDDLRIKAVSYVNNTINTAFVVGNKWNIT